MGIGGEKERRTYLETCSQRGALGFVSLKAASMSALILSKAIVSSLGHRLAAEFRSPSSPCSAFSPSESGAAPPSGFARGVFGEVEICSIGFTEVTAGKHLRVGQEKKKKKKKILGKRWWGKKIK